MQYAPGLNCIPAVVKLVRNRRRPDLPFQFDKGDPAMLETKPDPAASAREAEARAEKEWRREWKDNVNRVHARFRDEAAFLAARRRKFRSAAIIGSRQHRGIAQ